MVRKLSGRAPSLGKSVAAGVALGIIWTIISALIIAKLVESEILAVENVGYGSMVAVLSAVFLGASFAGKRAGHMVLPAMVVSGAAYFICLLMVNALFFGGSYRGLTVTALLVAVSTVLAILASGKGKGRSGHKRYKIPKG